MPSKRHPSTDELQIAAITQFLALRQRTTDAILERPAGARPRFLGASSADHGDGDLSVTGGGLPAIERDQRVTQQQSVARSRDPSRRPDEQSRQLGLNSPVPDGGIIAFRLVRQTDWCDVSPRADKTKSNGPVRSADQNALDAIGAQHDVLNTIDPAEGEVSLFTAGPSVGDRIERDGTGLVGPADRGVGRCQLRIDERDRGPTVWLCAAAF